MDEQQSSSPAHGSDVVLCGVLPVFQTPYRDDYTIDFETLEHEIDWLYQRGVDGVVMAMVSEVLRLSSEERDRMADQVCRFNCARGIVVISVGAETTHTAVRHARHAERCGASAVMAIPPVATGVGEAELVGYFRGIIEAVGIPLIVQDASSYVGSPMSVSMQASLLEQYGPQRILFKPEAMPLGPKLSELMAATGGQARMFEGYGGLSLVDNYRRGVVGTMPGADQIEAVVALWRALETGDQVAIDQLSPLISALVSLQSSLDAFLAVEKYLLVQQGVFKNTLVRGPVAMVLDDEMRREVDRLFGLLSEAVQSGPAVDSSGSVRN